MAKIIIPTPLRKFTSNQAAVAVQEGTVLESIRDLTQQFPDLDKHLFNEDQKLRGFVRIFIGENDIEDLEGQETRVNPGDTISIIPAIAGGL
ncbi:MAG TPA: MoaD/ThiS family protein [Saprospiraceae bacterium]|nr:MoaD/ThiS family protein [Saprospiraceae bacterium]HNT19800.1 MoaD/ThiS family protein [Saprospiraceae bacterium]